MEAHDLPDVGPLHLYGAHCWSERLGCNIVTSPDCQHPLLVCPMGNHFSKLVTDAVISLASQLPLLVGLMGFGPQTMLGETLALGRV